MFKWDKNLNAEAFAKPQLENTKCTIFVATNAYEMSINNLDIRLVVQWDIPLSFDSIIQQMG